MAEAAETILAKKGLYKTTTIEVVRGVGIGNKEVSGSEQSSGV